MYMGFFGCLAGTCFYATTAAAGVAAPAPTATGWPAMFARTPAMPTRTCSQIVVIFASVPLPAPAAAAVFGTMAMMDPKIVPRSSTTGIMFVFSCLRRGESVPGGGDVWPRAPRGGFIDRGRFPAARTCLSLAGGPSAAWSGRVRWARRFIGDWTPESRFLSTRIARSSARARVRQCSRDQ